MKQYNYYTKNNIKWQLIFFSKEIKNPGYHPGSVKLAVVTFLI